MILSQKSANIAWEKYGFDNKSQTGEEGQQNSRQMQEGLLPQASARQIRVQIQLDFYGIQRRFISVITPFSMLT